MLSPTPGTTTILGTSNILFQWSTGVGVTSYELLIGTNGVGTSNILNTGAHHHHLLHVAHASCRRGHAFRPPRFAYQRSVAVRRLRLHRERNGSSRHALSLFGHALNQPDLYLEQRQRGDLLPVEVGTTGPGSTDILDTGVTTETSATVSIPANGATVLRDTLSARRRSLATHGLHFHRTGAIPNYVVNTAADDATGTASNCTSSPEGICTLRDALAAANAVAKTAISPSIPRYSWHRIRLRQIPSRSATAR